MAVKPAITAVTVLALIIGACGREKPTEADGENVLDLLALDTSMVSGDEWVPVPGAEIKISCSDFEYSGIFTAGEEGRAVIRGLPAGNYNITAELIDEEENFLILGQKDRYLLHDTDQLDTLFMTYQQSSPLVINEMYSVGCDYRYFYFFDQFVELYNSSNDTIFLDGYFLCRGTHIEAIIDIEAEDYALAYYVYAFPGQKGVTRECPIAPGEFIVLASDAIDHGIVSGACMDLSGADWEFFNPTSGDYDNLDVPNLEPVTNVGNDFSMNLGHEAIWLSTGEEWNFGMHFDGSSEKEYAEIKIWTIVDGVEYSRSADSPKYLTVRVDAGLGGNGLSKYSARSIQRRFPGLDSNNSSFDFEINDPPTPGFHR